MQYDAIFFDFDGVLVESTDIKSGAFTSLYQDYGTSVVEQVLAHHALHEGISRLEKIRHCHDKFLDIKLDDDALAKLAGQYAALVEASVVDCDGVNGAIEFLDAHMDHIPMFVISGTPEDELKRIVTGRAMDHYFTAVFGSPRHKAPIIRDIFNRWGYDAGRVVFVGDAMTDYDAAFEMDVPFIGRVAPNRDSPFPAGTDTITDLAGLKI